MTKARFIDFYEAARQKKTPDGLKEDELIFCQKQGGILTPLIKPCVTVTDRGLTSDHRQNRATEHVNKQKDKRDQTHRPLHLALTKALSFFYLIFLYWMFYFSSISVLYCT